MNKHYLQVKITGTQGQLVGFDTNGNAVAQDMSGLDGRYILVSAKAAANGVASLGADGKVPRNQLPVYDGSVVIS